MIRRSLSLGVALAGLAAYGAAYADGFEHPDNGTVAVGRAGAYTARASEGSAVQYNVAALAGQRGTRLTVQLNLTDPNLCFDRDGTYADDGRDPNNGNARYEFNGQEYPEVCLESGFLHGPGPMLAISSDLGHANWPVFALGLYGPHSPEQLVYPETVTTANGATAPAPQRYDLVSRHLIVLFPTFAVSYQALPWLRLGGAFQAVFAKLQFTSAVTSSGSETPSTDYLTNLDTMDPFTPAGILAAQARFSRFDVGLSYRHSGDFEADGEVTFEKTAFTGSDLLEPRSDAIVYAPQNPAARVGVRYFHPRASADAGDWRAWDPMEDEVFDVEFDAVWEGNSAFDSLRIEVEEDFLDFTESLRTSVADPEIVHDWKDTIGFRLGGDYNLLPGRLAIRAGGLYEPGAAPVEYTRVDFLAFRKVGFFAGATYRLGGWDLSVGGGHLFGSPRDILNGKTRAIGPTGPSDFVINDGEWKASLTVISLGANYRF